jgi:NAD(P)-dependent dehydrogenase (short-subunit alcohol dehydrogenase family)
MGTKNKKSAARSASNVAVDADEKRPIGWTPPDLRGRVAVVAGASRGAGRGIALALGECGATVYVTARTVRGGPAPVDGAPGTIEETADEVNARGGRGISVAVDFTREADVAALFERVERDAGRLDILANSVFGWSAESFEAFLHPERKRKLFWEQSSTSWKESVEGGPYAHLLGAVHGARLMAKRGGGLIVSITEPIIGFGPKTLDWALIGLGHRGINEMASAMKSDLAKIGVTIVALGPGFMRTERVLMHMAGTSEKHKKTMGFHLSETPEYTGRAIAMLSADKKVSRHSGKLVFVGDLAKAYKFKDADGKFVENFYKKLKMI